MNFHVHRSFPFRLVFLVASIALIRGPNVTSDNPIFSGPNPFQEPSTGPVWQAPPPPNRSGGKGLLIVLSVVGVGLLGLCCGVGGLVYYAVQQVGTGQRVAELPVRSESFTSDAEQFNASLKQLADSPTDEAEINTFIASCVQRSTDGLPLPFSQTMFIEAVGKSPFGKGSISFADRLMVRQWLTESQPDPDIETLFRILAIHHQPNSPLAAVDLLSYSSENQAESYQWFLVKEAGRWMLYDWQRLEYGRRMSDEYAGYLRGSAPVADGYDKLMARMVELDTQWKSGDTEAAEAGLLDAEKTPMLRWDMPVAKLRMGYLWLSWGQNEQALRVLKTIQDPNQLWGVWPVQALAEINLGNHEAALELAQKAARQSPDHPNVHWLFSEVYAGLGRSDAAADAALRAVTICPKDTMLFSTAVRFNRPGDVPALLNLLAHSPDSNGWSQVLRQATYSTPWGEALVAALPQIDSAPLGAQQIAAGNLAWSEEDFDAAAKHFLAAGKVAELPYLQEMARSDYMSARLEQERYGELFDESEDLDATLRELVVWAFDDDLYAEPEKLLDAIKQRPQLNTNLWTPALRGWAHTGLEQPDAALSEFTTFADRLASEPEKLSEDDQWIISSTDYFITDSLLQLQRPAEVVRRYPSDVVRHEQITAYLLRQYDRTLIDEHLMFLAGNRDTEQAVPSLELQQLQLQAELALRDGDVEPCDARHQQAIRQSWVAYDSNQAYYRNAITRRRMRDLIWNQQFNAAVDLGAADGNVADDQALRWQQLTQAAQVAYELKDPVSLNMTRKRAVNVAIEAADSLAEIQANQGELLLELGQASAAVGLLQQSFANLGEDASWVRRTREKTVVSAMLRAGQYDQAAAWLAENSDSEPSAVAPPAIAALAQGDATRLADLLAAAERSEPGSAGDWLSDSRYEMWLRQYAAEPWMIDLLRQYPVQVGYHLTAAEGVLLLNKDAAVSADSLRQWLRKALGQPIDLRGFESDVKISGLQTWLAESSNGQRILLHLYPVDCQTAGLDADSAIRLQTTERALRITIADDQPHAMRRLFAVAEQASQQTDGVGFWLPESRLLWAQPNLATSLAWDDRVPVSRSVYDNPMLTLETLDEEDSAVEEYIGLESWKQRLEEAGGKLEVRMSVSVGSSSEALIVELKSVDAENYEVLVQPKTDSVLVPWIKAGISYSTGSGYLNSMTPEP